VATFLSLLSVLVAVGFFTLLERKVLSYIILRKGPNKPSLLGIFTPFADALKLFGKHFVLPTLSVNSLLLWSCRLSFLIPAILWSFIYLPSGSVDSQFTVVSLLIWISLSVYYVLAAGWGSNSKYAILGRTRCLAQCISYEVVFSVLLICYCLFFGFRFLTPSV